MFVCFAASSYHLTPPKQQSTPPKQQSQKPCSNNLLHVCCRYLALIQPPLGLNFNLDSAETIVESFYQGGVNKLPKLTHWYVPRAKTQFALQWIHCHLFTPVQISHIPEIRSKKRIVICNSTMYIEDAANQSMWAQAQLSETPIGSTKVWLQETIVTKCTNTSCNINDKDSSYNHQIWISI